MPEISGALESYSVANVTVVARKLYSNKAAKVEAFLVPPRLWNSESTF